MDPLDRLATPARDLLARVDVILAAVGTPNDPALATVLRRVGALPGDALAFVAQLHAEPLRSVAGELRSRAHAYGGGVDDVTRSIEGVRWAGAAADGFRSQWRALASYLGGSAVAGRDVADDEHMTGRLLLLATYADAVADWMVQTRVALASTLATVLGSGEAVVLRSSVLDHGPLSGRVPRTGGVGEAAAVVAHRVLSTVDDGVQEGEELHRRCASLLEPLAYRLHTGPAEGGVPAASGATRVPFGSA